MTILAHSELLKRICHIDEHKLEKPFIILQRNNTTAKRMNVLRELVNHKEATVGFLLQQVKQPRSGGSYLTMQKYFQALVKEGLLQVSEKNNKTYYSLAQEYQELKKYMLR